MINIIYKIYDRLHPKLYQEHYRRFDKANKLLENFNLKIPKELKENVFMMGLNNINKIIIQLPQIIAALKNNYKIIIILSSPNWSLERIYRKIGVKKFLYYVNHFRSVHHKTDDIYNNLKKNDFLKNEIYRGVNIIKLIVSTYLRKKKLGRIDFNSINIKDLKKDISNCLNYTDHMISLFSKYKPKKFFFEDRGYIPDGIFFNLAILYKIDVIEFHVGHKSGILTFKRFNNHNKDQHPFSVSKTSFNKLKNKDFNIYKKKEVLDEIEDCYLKGNWFDQVGTAFNKKSLNKSNFIKRFSLDPNKKIAILFTHILWDATFFYGKDIFLDYEEWLIKSIEHMLKIKNVNWLIKCHPANTVKNYKEKSSIFAETEAIKKNFKSLPHNIKILDHECNISTFSLFKFIDCCITVRGTVGIEAACFGIPVITAGTGRYNDLGFTIDSNNINDYYKNLSNIPYLKKSNKESKELALKYAYITLLSKQIKTDIINFKYNKNKGASLEVKINSKKNNFLHKDVGLISKWLKTKDEDLISF